jgi:predicted permease
MVQGFTRPIAALTRKGFGLVIALAVGITIGLAAAMWGVAGVLLLQAPPGVRQPERVFTVHDARNYQRYLALRNHLRSADLAAYTVSEAQIGMPPYGEPAPIGCVTSDFFTILGTRITGRSFQSGDDDGGAESEVILSHGFARRTFAQTSDAIGREVLLSGRRYTIVGIAAPDFAGLRFEPVDLWIPLLSAPDLCSFTGSSLLEETRSAWLTTVARLRDGCTKARLASELQILLGNEGGESRMRAVHRPSLETVAEARRDRSPRERQIAKWLATGAFLLVLVACCNVAGLLGIASVDREEEMRIRHQLGATRLRVVALMLTGSLRLVAPSAAVAVVAAAWVEISLRRLLPAAAVPEMLSLRGAVVLVASVAAVVLVSGFWPAIQASRFGRQISPWSRLRGEQHAARLRHLLLIVQVVAAVVLLVASSLLSGTVRRATDSPGYDLDRLVVASIDLEKAGYITAESIRTAIAELLVVVRRHPDVEAVSATSGSLLDFGLTMAVGVGASPSKIDTAIPLSAVSPGYFATAGTPVLRGRPFTVDDDARTAPVMIVDEEMARRTWPEREALGQCAFVSGCEACVRVIGVSRARRAADLTRKSAEVFIPIAQARHYRFDVVPRNILIRTRSPGTAPESLGKLLRSRVPQAVAIKVRRLAELADLQTRAWRLAANLFDLFGSASVAMVAVALFGSLGLSVRQRSPEIGLRVALGASPARVVADVLGHGAVVILAGCAVGAVASAWLVQYSRSLLYQAPASDWGAVVLALAIVMCAALVGCVGPAIRLIRISPVRALRCQ